MRSTRGMSLNFRALHVDNFTGSAAQNMADDILLQRYAGEHSVSIVRTYGWERGSKTFGRYQSFRQLGIESGDGALVRRPTGGGLVNHDADNLTWSLCIPRGFLDDERVSVVFRKCQWSIKHSLEQLFDFSTHFAESAEKRPGVCFNEPVSDDLISLEGQKVSGIAMHRSREAILLQGSLQGLGFEISLEYQKAFLTSLCEHITGIVVEKSVGLTTLIQSELRDAEKAICDSDSWLRARA